MGIYLDCRINGPVKLSIRFRSELFKENATCCEAIRIKGKPLTKPLRRFGYTWPEGEKLKVCKHAYTIYYSQLQRR